MIRALVDRDRCEGYSQCNALAPELFEVDDDGVATPLVEEVPPELRSALENAVASCPTRALSVLTDGDGA